MVPRVMPSAVLIVLTAVMLAGCGRPAAKESAPDLNLLATGPERQTLPTPRPFVSAALDATGGLAAWEACKKIEFHAAVTARERDGCFYLTEQDFVLCPWSEAIQVTAHEPGADVTWQVVRGRYHAPQVDPKTDVSPLRGLSRDYADAVLRIVTAPVRMLDDNVQLSRRPALTQITGQWCLPIDATYKEQTGSEEKTAAPYWTQGIYFQRADRSLVDMIWLGNPRTQKFLLARGYDYAPGADAGVLLPTKIEVFRSDAEARIGPRLALVDVEQ
jgi:hypothetical protein